MHARRAAGAACQASLWLVQRQAKEMTDGEENQRGRKTRSAEQQQDVFIHYNGGEKKTKKLAIVHQETIEKTFQLKFNLASKQSHRPIRYWWYFKDCCLSSYVFFTLSWPGVSHLISAGADGEEAPFFFLICWICSYYYTVDVSIFVDHWRQISSETWSTVMRSYSAFVEICIIGKYMLYLFILLLF